MGKRVYIISDLEGVAGIVSRVQLGPEGSEYEIARSYLTHEVNAAIDGCIEAGASDITVLDGHGHPRGYNIDLAIADDRAEYVIGTHRSSTLPFLNESFDAVFLIGYHAMAGAERAVWSHTQSWESIVSYSINGEEFGEIGQMAIIAGTFEVPVVLVTGDQAAINEAKSVIPGIIGIVVKEGDSRFCARTVTPNRSQTLIKSGAVEATTLIDKISPVRIDFPCEIKMTVSDSDFADEMERSGMLRTGKLTLSKTGQSFRDIP